jgi:hypothetical protein
MAVIVAVCCAANVAVAFMVCVKVAEAAWVDV